MKNLFLLPACMALIINAGAQKCKELPPDYYRVNKRDPVLGDTVVVTVYNKGKKSLRYMDWDSACYFSFSKQYPDCSVIKSESLELKPADSVSFSYVVTQKKMLYFGFYLAKKFPDKSYHCITLKFDIKAAEKKGVKLVPK